MHEKPKIFPSIPWLPGEPARHISNPLSSPFAKKEAKLLIDYPTVLRVLKQFKPEESEKSKSAADIRRIAFNLESLNLIKEIIQNKISAEQARMRPEGQSEVKRMLRLNEALDTAPEHSRVRFMFELHTIESQKQYFECKEHLRQELRKTFKKGEVNIFFSEEGLTINNATKIFERGFKKFNSAFKAYIYRFLFTQYNREPTAFEVELETRRQKEGLVKIHPLNFKEKFQELYIMAGHEVIDELIKEGYNIKIVFEQFEKINGNQARIQERLDSRGGKNALKEAKVRNEKILQQVLDAVSEAEEVKKPTNIFVRLGTYHYFLHEIIPANLKAVTSISIEENGILLANEIRRLEETGYFDDIED